VVGIEAVDIRLGRDELEALISILVARLREVREERKRVEEVLKRFEARYRISTQRFMELLERASRRECSWPLPDDADMDVIEWEAYARLWMELLNEEKRISELLDKLQA